MLEIWHHGDWTKRVLDQPTYGWVECGSPISSWLLHSLMRSLFPWFSCVNRLVYVWILWLIYLWYLCCYYARYIYVL